MKKKIRIVVLVCLALFLFSYYKTNAGKPHDLKVKKYEFGQKITYEDFDFTVDKGEIFVNMDRDMIPIIYTVKNKKSEKTNAAKLLLRIAYRNGLSNDEICQNFIEPSLPPNPYDYSFPKVYKPDDFILEPYEEKTFDFYYITDRVYYEKYPSCLKFPNEFYWDKLISAIDDQSLYYEILEWNNQ
jgi:hypothetical protein